jgi:alkanesulfonate monooxygenase SsuD/methylene tetrahydromethanopterin reductase-like flavin-dependent oxidoreductase (luciferase family)
MMRFDLRSPAALGAEAATQYRAAVEMAAWGEAHGALAVTVSEHHGVDDGYLPSPLVLAAAIAGATTTLAIQVSALVLPLHDPVRLAEDMAVLDLVSGGRVGYVLGLGYRADEFAMFGLDISERVRRMEDGIATLRAAFAGETFDVVGHPTRVTPRPATPGGPPLSYGGGSAAAARRAARLGMNFLAQASDPGLAEAYTAEAARLGIEPGNCMVPAEGFASCVFVSENPDETWDRIGHHLLHDAHGYAAFEDVPPSQGTMSQATTVDELREERGAYRILTPAEARDYLGTYGVLVAHPLCGGTPPEVGWESLRLIVDEVLATPG